jgi:hypothetical protein
MLQPVEHLTLALASLTPQQFGIQEVKSRLQTQLQSAIRAMNASVSVYIAFIQNDTPHVYRQVVGPQPALEENPLA